MRRFLLAAALAAAAALAGPAGTASAAGDPDTLVVGTMWEPLPLNMKARRSRFYNESEILDTLVKLDYDMSLQPGLATRWERTDPTTWVFHLRDGVKFHDGTALTAGVAKASLERVMAQLPYAKGLLTIESMEAVDPLTLKIATTEPFAALPNQLTDAFTGIYAPASFDAEGKLVAPIGTGPYRFVSYQPEDRTVVERFDGYWGEAPAIGRIVYRYIPDHGSRVIALEAGEVDFADNLPPAEARRLEGVEGIQVFAEPTAGLYYMVLNTRSPSPLADARVRRALDLLVDRDALVTHALDGAGLPAKTFFSQALGGMPKETPRRHDPEAAAALLTEAGWTRTDAGWTRDGEPLKLDLLSYASRTEMPILLEAVAGMLREAGVEVTLDLLTWPAMMDQVKAGSYDGYIVFWTPEMTGHPDLHLMAHLHSKSGLDENGYANPELDARLEEGRRIDAGPESAEIYRQALEIVRQDAPVVPLVHKTYLAAAAPRVHGYRVHPSGFFHDFKSVSLGQ